ncbi:protein indeterminate-domain 14-like isoform X1 [Zingiber officinale]|uniref:protein indeterminate-domain 14-like isoform X1 n=2 Tax=Zingiber officinale TaxID=94328 RepID=UPI001C4D8511|nr:protein indeterminate-domain 14-like isoform X1 [Zingiber officinale]
MLSSSNPAKFAALPPKNSTTIASMDQINGGKRKRRPAGTPDPDAEVVSLSPRTLLEADRYVCEICGQGFQREQNLQMHRRRHKVPWKLVRRQQGGEASGRNTKRVFVCPEASCLHHDPRHALGDLVGIKKHFRRKHSNHRQWACDRCGKAYAVHSDYKAHLKTCGTRGHSCDCGRVFSRVESFIEHQDSCDANRAGRPSSQSPARPPLALSIAAASTAAAAAVAPNSAAAAAPPFLPMFMRPPPPPPPIIIPNDHRVRHHHNLELQLLPATSYNSFLRRELRVSIPPDEEAATSTELQLSIGPPGVTNAAAEARDDEEAAEKEFADAKRIRQQARAELENAYVLRERAKKRIASVLLQITCHSCRKQWPSKLSPSTSSNHDTN